MIAAFTSQIPRIITGLGLTGALVAVLVLGGAYLRAALCLVSILALYEFFQMRWHGLKKTCSKVFGFIVCAAIFCPETQREPLLLGVILMFVLLWAALAFLFDYGRGNENARFEEHAFLPLGILYVPIILQLALHLTVKEQFLVVLMAAASDTAAYYAGCAFGRHKIWPLVSPKKSWEGSIAGFVASVAIVVAMACIPFAGGTLHGGNWIVWIFVGALLNILSQLGDFFESALKRSCNTKDSSRLLPGHGGILDRIDSIIFALAAYSAIRLLLVNWPGLSSWAVRLFPV